jgi:hypothetical protein
MGGGSFPDTINTLADTAETAIKVIDGVKYVVDIYGDIIDKYSNLKRQYEGYHDEMMNRNAVPLNTSAGASGSSKTPERDVRQVKPKTKRDSHLTRTYPSVIDGNRMGIGAENLLNTLVCRLNPVAYSDNVAEFLKRMNRKLTYSNEFCLQLMSNEQERHVQMHWFRHSHSNATGYFTWPNLAYVLQPSAADPINGNIGAPNPNLPGLNVLAFGEGQTQPNGSSLYAPVSRQDLEEMSMKCFTQSPSFDELANRSRVYEVQSGSPDTVTVLGNASVPFQEHVLGSHPRKSLLELGNLGPNSDHEAYWPNKLKAVIVDGGVNYLFENKHGTDCKIEIIVVKVKKGHENVANGFLSGYASELGKAWVKRKSAWVGTDKLNGKAPLETDVFTNPYYPLLPEDSRNANIHDVHLTQKKRFAFCLPSGAKRSVKIPFGGHVYDPAHCRTTPTQGATTNLYEPGLAVGVIIAINGQMVSSFNTHANDNLQLISRDMISGTNVVVMGEYYERVQAAKLDSEPTSRMYSKGDIDPHLATSEGWETKAMQIVPSGNVLRGPTVANFIGHTTHQSNGFTGAAVEQL